MKESVFINSLRNLLVIMTAWTLLTCTKKQPADLIFYNGQVAIVDNAFTIHSAIAIKADKVLAVGGKEILTKYHASKKIDLKGRLAIPGFNDTHTHIFGYARRYIHLAKVKSIEEIKDSVRAKVKLLGPGEWITGWGWSEDELKEGRRPLRWDLDEAAPKNPVVLHRAGGHSNVSNSFALNLSGVTSKTPNPKHGIIEKDKNGNLNGVVREGFLHTIKPTPKDKEEAKEDFIRKLKEQLSLGFTSSIQAMESIDSYKNRWQPAYKKYPGELPRATVQIKVVNPKQYDQIEQKIGEGDEWLKMGPIKVFVDGGYTGPGAFTLFPYKNQPTFFGKLRQSRKELKKIIEVGHEKGWQFGIHAIGDGAIKMVVDVFDEVLTKSPRKDHRNFLNHFTVPPPEETYLKMVKNNILVAQQPCFTWKLEGRYVAHLEGYRLEHNNPVKSVMDKGIFMALGTDIMPLDPMIVLYAAVTRKGMSGRVFAPDERITIQEAIVGLTRNGAFLTREEKIKGTLEPGMLADMIILDQNLLTIDPDSIPNVKVDLTVLGGKIVYKRD